MIQSPYYDECLPKIVNLCINKNKKFDISLYNSLLLRINKENKCTHNYQDIIQKILLITYINNNKEDEGALKDLLVSTHKKIRAI